MVPSLPPDANAEMVGDPVAETQHPLVDQSADRQGQQRFDRAAPVHEGIRGERHTGPGLADRGVQEWAAVARDVQLCRGVRTPLDAVQEQLPYVGEVTGRAHAVPPVARAALRSISPASDPRFGLYWNQS